MRGGRVTGKRLRLLDIPSSERALSPECIGSMALHVCCDLTPPSSGITWNIVEVGGFAGEGGVLCAFKENGAHCVALGVASFARFPALPVQGSGCSSTAPLPWC